MAAGIRRIEASTGKTSGEVVFSTGMTGYTLSLTDPSYYGQLLILSFPTIGIYGVSNKRYNKNLLLNFESEKIHAKGLIVSDYSKNFSHYQANKSLGTWLKEQKVPALSNIDTRELIKHIREKGSMLCKIVIENSHSKILSIPCMVIKLLFCFAFIL